MVVAAAVVKIYCPAYVDVCLHTCTTYTSIYCLVLVLIPNPNPALILGSQR